MTYITDKDTIDDIWEKRSYKDKPGIPECISKIADEDLKTRIHDVWLLIYANFGKKLINKEDVQTKIIRNCIYKYIQDNFFKEIGGVSGLVDWLKKNECLDGIDKTTIEEFIRQSDKLKKLEVKDAAN